MLYPNITFILYIYIHISLIESFCCISIPLGRARNLAYQSNIRKVQSTDREHNEVDSLYCGEGDSVFHGLYIYSFIVFQNYIEDSFLASVKCSLGRGDGKPVPAREAVISWVDQAFNKIKQDKVIFNANLRLKGFGRIQVFLLDPVIEQAPIQLFHLKPDSV